MIIWQKERQKTYNRRDSQMVTHSSTSRPVQCLCMAERTGCPVLTDLWSYVFIITRNTYIKLQIKFWLDRSFQDFGREGGGAFDWLGCRGRC